MGFPMAYNILSRKNFLQLLDNSFRKDCTAELSEDEQRAAAEKNYPMFFKPMTRGEFLLTCDCPARLALETGSIIVFSVLARDTQCPFGLGAEKKGGTR